VANIPVLRAGLPPIIIPREERKDYINALSDYHFAVGKINADDELLPELEKLKPFTEFCRLAWQALLDLVEEVREKQRGRCDK
jgi:hypothetical protein